MCTHKHTYIHVCIYITQTQRDMHTYIHTYIGKERKRFTYTSHRHITHPYLYRENKNERENLKYKTFKCQALYLVIECIFTVFHSKLCDGFTKSRYQTKTFILSGYSSNPHAAHS